MDVDEDRIVTLLHKGDREALRDLLRECPELLASDTERSILIRAYDNNRELLPWLLDQGVPADQSEQTYALLMHVAAHGDADTAGLLLERGADPNALNDMGETAFGYACALNKPEVARVLYEHGADLNYLEPDGHTPLDLAKFDASEEFYDWLLSIGCVHNTWEPGWVGGRHENT